MTQRLPTPGGDNGDWGSILNAFLQVAHNTDGTLQTSAISSGGGITGSQVGSANGVAGLNNSGVVPATQLGTGTASGSNFLRGDGVWAVPSGGGGGVTTFNTRSGAVTSQSGDYTAAQVGALPSTDDLSAIATANATAADVNLNSHKITNLTNGTAASDAAAFGQIPVAGTTSGTYTVGNDSRLTGAASKSFAIAMGVVL